MSDEKVVIYKASRWKLFRSQLRHQGVFVYLMRRWRGANV